MQWRSDGSALLAVAADEQRAAAVAEQQARHGDSHEGASLGGRSQQMQADATSPQPRLKSRASAPALVCQVPGCGAPLFALKEYYQRYRICEHHRQMDQMVGKDGELQRFCQQCGRFHLLTAFDDNKRSCRERLARHNERRRRRTAGEPISSSAGKLPALGSGTLPDMMDASAGNHGDAGSWAAPEQLQASAVFAHPSLGIWEQRHLQLQALQLQGLEHHIMTAAVDTRPHRMDLASLSSPFDQIHSAASDYSSELSSHFTAVSAADATLLAHSRATPRMLAPVSDANLQVAYACQPTFGSAGSIAITAPSAVSIVDMSSRAQRKTLSWPLAQIRLDEATPEQQGLITGTTCSFGPIHHTYTNEGVMLMRTTGAGMPYRHVAEVSTSYPASQVPALAMMTRIKNEELRTLGENQTLDSIWENIMLIDDADDV